MDVIKRMLRRIPLPITKNQWYDILTTRILRKRLHNASNCVDIGCLEGDILRLFLRFAPEGKHFAFEPIPAFYREIADRYGDRATLYNLALSNTRGESEFHFVTSNPSYSGIRKRRYDRPSEQVEKIVVAIDTLDNVLDREVPVDLIKIDVEGAEMMVLEGAKETLRRHAPDLLFEHGKGGADSYGYGPSDIFALLHETHGYSLFTLKDWLKGRKALDLPHLEEHFASGSEYYFFATKKV